MSGPPDLMPYGEDGRYLLDSAGVAYRRVDDGPPRPLVPIPLKIAARHARADFRFEARDKREVPGKDGPIRVGPKDPAPLVLVEGGERVVEWVLVPPPEVRTPPPPAEDAPYGIGPSVAWWAGGTTLAVGDTDTGWYALTMGDGSTHIFHGPSMAARLFRGMG